MYCKLRAPLKTILFINKWKVVITATCAIEKNRKFLEAGRTLRVLLTHATRVPAANRKTAFENTLTGYDSWILLVAIP